MIRGLTACSILLCAIFLLSCTTTTPVRERGPVRVGMYADLSSSGAQDGNDALKGAQLRVNDINAAGGIGGRPMELVALDMKQSPTEAVKAFTVLAQEDGVCAVIGSTVANAGLSVSPVADLSKVPLISLSIDDRVTSPDLKPDNPDQTGAVRPYAFLVQPSAIQLASALAAYAADHFLIQRYATLCDPANKVSVMQARAFESAVKQAGKVVAASLAFEGDFGALLPKIKDADVEALFVCGSMDTNLTIARAVRDTAYQSLILGNQAWSAPLLDQAGGALNNVWFCEAVSPEDTGLADLGPKFAAQFGGALRPAVVPGWDAIGLVAAAVRKAGSSKPQKVRDALEQTMGYKCLGGQADMDARTHKLLTLPVAIMRIVSGTYTTVEPRYVAKSGK
jgi:branched-chain amino acid transport system substrate-binding protein